MFSIYYEHQLKCLKLNSSTKKNLFFWWTAWAFSDLFYSYTNKCVAVILSSIYTQSILQEAIRGGTGACVLVCMWSTHCRSSELRLIKPLERQCSVLPSKNRQAFLDLLLRSARQQHSSILRSSSFHSPLLSSSSSPPSTAARVRLQG